METLEIYAPFANRLGIGWIRTEMEDLAFKFLHEKEYKEMAKKVAAAKATREEYIKEAIEIVKKELAESRVEAEIQGRAKHFYSIYQKINKRGVPFEEIHDLMGIRIITKNKRDCYAALGAVHTLWKPIPGKFKDYIALPKPNMYRSIHTTVIGHKAQPLEIQIRTVEMHLISEEGIAAHWVYKEGKKAASYQSEEHYKWIRQLLGQLQNETQEFKDPRALVEAMKKGLLKVDRVYAFTPKGEVKELPAGSTMVDFAYAVHSEIGNTCTGAKVNGKIVPLNTPIKMGDRVVILTAKTHTPSSDWLKFVVTPNAKSKIQAFIRAQESQKSMELGKEILTRELKKIRANLAKVMKEEQFNDVLAKLNFQKAEDMFAAVGFGTLSKDRVLHRLHIAGIIEDPTMPVKETTAAKVIRTITGQRPTGIKIEGVDDVVSKIAKCCNPIPGEKIIGFITRGRGLTVHRADCPNVVNYFNPERTIEVEWEVKGKKTFPVNLHISAKDRTGLLADTAKAISNLNTYIESESMKSIENNMAEGKFRVDVESLDHLNKIIKALRKVKGIEKVTRS